MLGAEAVADDPGVVQEQLARVVAVATDNALRRIWKTASASDEYAIAANRSLDWKQRWVAPFLARAARETRRNRLRGVTVFVRPLSDPVS